MAAFTAWLNDVMPELPQCPQALALYHVQRAAFDLMKRGKLYRKTSAALTVSANANDISLATVAGTNYQILGVERAWWLGKELDPATLEAVEGEYGDAWESEIGEPRMYLQQAAGTIRLVPQMDSETASALRVSVIYGPAETLTTVPDDIYDRYREPIAFGAKARLMLMDNKPWSNAQKGLAYQGIFNDAVLAAQLRSTRGTGGVRWLTTPYPF